MTKYTTVLADLLRPLSRSNFESAISGYAADFRVRILDTYNLFKIMLFAQITGCFSVREIVTSLLANSNLLYHAGLQEVKRSTFCDALESRRPDIFRSVFHYIVDEAQILGNKLAKKFKDPLRIIDASIISLCIHRFDWAKYRTTKGAIKLHMNLDGDNNIPFEAYLTTGNVHDAQIMNNLTQETGVIYVMDRGYVDYKSLYCIELGGSIFVTRMKSNGAYKIINAKPVEKDGPVISDVEIVLTGSTSKQNYPKPFRKIKYYDEESKKTYEFITNDMDRDAKEIAAIYKERWQVELFFKWIKQHLKIKSFWGTSENAVFNQIWVALIMTILLWINQTLNGIKVSAYKLLIMIKSTLLTKNTIIGLCTNIKKPQPPVDPQLFFEGFKC